MLINPQYEGFYGSIGRIGKSSVQTLFYHFAALPIFPQGTYWVSGNMGTSWSTLEVMEIERSIPSILAGYLRGWSLVSGVYLAIFGAVFLFLPGQQIFDGDPMPFGRSIAAPIGIALGAMALFASIVIWAFTRFPVSKGELARRAVFAPFVGTACDPAALESPWSRRDDLKRAMASIAEQLGYGKSYDVFARWPEIALRPEMRVPEYLRMAMTVARLIRAAPETDAGTRSVADPATLPRIEEQIFARLCEIDPSARAARPV